MNKKIKYRIEKMTASDKELIESVASKFKDVALFPERYESAKKFLDNLKNEDDLSETFTKIN